MKPVGLIITGHAGFASGLKEALEMLNGDLKDVETADLEKGESETAFALKLKEQAEKMGDLQILYLVDLAGSIPYKAASEMANPRAVVAGINLGMVLEIEQMRHFVEDLDTLIAQALLVGKEQILALEEDHVSA